MTNLDDETHWVCVSTLARNALNPALRYSGYDDTKGGYTQVQANANAPSLPGGCGGGDTGEWVGIGGNNDLVQTGVILLSGTIEGFYEYLGAGGSVDPVTGGYYAGSGDSLYFRVLAQPASSNINFLSQDGGAHLTMTLGGAAYQDYTGETGEGDFVTEPHDLSGGANEKHSPVNWTNAKVTRGGTTYGASTDAPQALHSVNNGGGTVEQPSGFHSTTSFDDDWVAC